VLHALSAALVARPVHNHGGMADNPPEDGDFQKFLFGQRTDLFGYRQAHTRDVKVGGVVAKVDVGFPGVDILTAVNLVVDLIEDTECSRPEFEKPVTDVAEPVAQQKGDEYSRQVQDHEERENEKHPGDIQLAGDGPEVQGALEG